MNMIAIMGVMLVGSLAWTIWFLKKPLADNGVDLRQSNIDIAKQRKLELQRDLDQDLIDREQFELALDEISTTLAVELEQQSVKTSNSENNTLSMLAIVALLPIFSIGIYQSLSTYAPTSIATPVVDSKPLTLEQSIEKLKQHLSDEPNDAEAWTMLGLSYFELDKVKESLEAYEKAYQLTPNNSKLLVEYASTLISVNDNQFSDRPVALIKQALEIDANAPDALYLAGMFAISMQDFTLAKGLWNKALSVLPVGGDDNQALLGLLDELRRAESGQVSNTVTVNVLLSDQILATRSAEDYLMIYVKAAKGRPMPIAIQKLKLKDFNGQIVLSDMNSVMPTKLLSEHDKVLVVARLSRTGGAMKQADDIQITSGVVNVSDNPNITLELQ
ncbi:c-type cytochrome biogenesis protein CcmI [Candidatus Thioglobus sp.]|uniref:c-type cytochrome biogenesis protein CcmI n=1 Tax=Candidatus Thioglobus sp. TaxID=2026721 RepID=UPI0017792CD7|nr:c-type cytochrome biogenesis protein CcmI [Candidatus Thioglobus sp.]HIF47926.1 c-type cytochrome biogenesis protein CcmI [Candidatus Thioglobus sp.]